MDSKLDWQPMEAVLGYLPYPGTLNVSLDYRMPRIKEDSVTKILRGACIPATINGLPCHLYSQKFLTGAKGVFVIAPVRLRDALNLQDGDRVLLEFDCEVEG